MNKSTSVNILNWRYATKKFDTSKILSHEKVNILKESFNLTATSYGLQPLKLLVIQDKSLQEKLVDFSWNQRQVADASHVLVFCIERKLNPEYIKKHFERVKAIRQTPQDVLNPFQDFLIDTFEDLSTEEIQQWSKNQAYLAMGNLLTICALEEIDACPMEGFDPLKYDDILDLKSQNLKSVLVMPIGYRAVDDMFASLKKVRRPINETVIELKGDQTN